MNIFETISFATNLEKEQYISVLQLVEMVKNRNGVGIDIAAEFIKAARVAELCLYSCQHTLEKDFDYQSIGINQKLDNDIYSIACFEDVVRTDKTYQSRYEDELDKLNKQYFKRLDLLNLELIVKNTDIVRHGNKLVLQHIYSNMMESSNDIFLTLPQYTRDTILEFLEPNNQNNDYVASITQQLADEKRKVAQLIAEKEQAQSTGSFMMGTPEVTSCEPKTDKERVIELEKEVAAVTAELKEYKDVPTDDKELAPNSQTKVACMLYAILKTHDYDLSPPMGKGLANDLIVNASQVQGTPVTKNFVAEWLKRANQAKINCSKK
ncbi:hypothetical protein ACTXLK_00385 [Psychrobacter faecalis]